MPDVDPDRVVDGLRLRSVMSHHPTGVAVAAATCDSGEPVGMVVGTFTSVSLAPPLVAFLPSRTSGTFARMRRTNSFSISVLSAQMDDVRRSFAAREQHQRWRGVRWHAAPSGAPVLDGAVAWVDCSYDSVHSAGDHYIVVGRVTCLGAAAAPPLVFHDGGYGTVEPRWPLERGLEIA